MSATEPAALRRASRPRVSAQPAAGLRQEYSWRPVTRRRDARPAGTRMAVRSQPAGDRGCPPV